MIYALGTGGLENGLVNIINRSPNGRYRHAVVCLTSAHAFAARITDPTVTVYELHKRDGQDWKMYWRLYRLLRQLRPAILHTRNLAALDVNILAPLLPGVRHIHGEHGRDIYDLDGSNQKYRYLRRIMRLFVDRFVTVSRDLESWLEQDVGIPPEKVRQIYNGVDHSRFPPRQTERQVEFPTGFLAGTDPLVIGTVGRLAAVKDQQLLLRGFASLVARKPELESRLRLVLVGDGPLADELARLAGDLGLEGRVWMTGDRDDVADLLRSLDIFVLPSLGEGISNTILEAMSCGLPVVASAVGGNPELVQHGSTGLLFPPGDAEALDDSLGTLVASAPMREQFGAAGRRRVEEQFDWSRTVADYFALYDEVRGVSAVPQKPSAGIAGAEGLNKG